MEWSPAVQRAPLLWLLLPLAGGIALGHAGATAWASPAVWLGVAGLAAGAAWGTQRQPRVWATLLALALVATGAARHADATRRLPEWDTLPPREAQLVVRVERLFPAPVEERRALGLGRITGAPPHLADVVGQRVFFGVGWSVDAPAAPGFVRSAEVELLGILASTPAVPEPGSFDDYLRSVGAGMKLNRARLVREAAPATAWYRWHDRLAQRFAASLSHGLAHRPELAGVLRAMMLGWKQELSATQQDTYLRSGTMHLFAISGLHIAAIATALHLLLSVLRLPALVRYLGATAALWIYVEATGAAPSSVRAWTMVFAVETALLVRAPHNGTASLAIAALAVLLVDPLQLLGASFQMSYGIVLALLLYGLPLGAVWSARTAPWRDVPEADWRFWQRAADGLRRVVIVSAAMGVASLLVSTITGVQYFQMVTPGGFFANLLLIPLSTLVIFAGCASLLCGLAGLTPACVLFNHAAALVLAVMEWLIAQWTCLPVIAWQAEWRTPWLGGAMQVVLLAALLVAYRQRDRPRLAWWLPPATVAAALIFGVRLGGPALSELAP